MASYPKRARGLVTEVLCSPGEQETLRAVSAVPPEQQRLVFGPSAPLVAAYSGQDPLFAELQATQVIIFQDTRALGRLVNPRVLVDSPRELAPVSLVSLIYDYWQPASVDRKQEPVQHLRIPLDSRYCNTSVFCIRAIVTGWPGGAVALPGRHEWSGSKTAAAVSQHKQRLNYIRTQQRLFTEGEGKDSPNRHLLARSDAEYTIDTGPEWEASSLSLTFNTGAELPWLQRIILKLLVIRKAPVDDKGGPVGETSAKATVSSSSVGTSACPLDMASASPQPVPQGHSTRGNLKPTDDRLPQAQQAETGTSYSSPVGCSASDTEAECIGANTPVNDTPTKSNARLSPSVALPANSGEVDDCCRRGASQPTWPTGGGGESHDSSDSEDECAAHRQLGNGQEQGGMATDGGSGLDSGGDRGDSGREREEGQEGPGASPNSDQKHKGKGYSEVSNAMINGRESQQSIILCSSHSDREAAASLQDASSRSTTMDTADASSDAADEPHAGVAESKPTVRLIQNCSGLARGQLEEGVFQLGVDQVLSSEGQYICMEGDGIFRAQGGAAADAPGCANGCCGRVNSAPRDAGDENPRLASETMPSAVDSNKAEDFAVADASSLRAGSKSSSASRRQSDETGATDRLGIASSQPGEELGNLVGSSPGLRKAMAAAASDGVLVMNACAGSQPLPPPQAAAFNASLASTQLPPPPPPPPPSSHHQQQQRSYSNGAIWPQTHAKGSSHGSEQPQQMLSQPHASSTSHIPNLSQVSHHGAHTHSLQNGKLRNGEVPGDLTQWAQQLLPNLGMVVPGQGGSGSATPSPGPQPLHPNPQSAGQSQGLTAANVQNILLAFQSGTLQMPHQGLPLPSQHLQSGMGVYGLSLHHQQLLAHHTALLQQQFLQNILHLQQHAAHQAPQQVQQQISHEPRQQLGTQGLSHMHLQSMETQYGAASTGDAPTAFASSSPTLTITTHTSTVPCTSTESAAETCASPAEGSIQQQPQGPIPIAAHPLHPAPIAAPTPAIAQHQSSGAQSSDAAGQSGWDSGSASSARSEPSTAVAPPLVERPIGPQHRVQSQGNILASGHGSVTGSQLGQRDGGAGGGRSSYRGRTSFSGVAGPSTGPPAGSASSTGAAGQPSGMAPGGGAYGSRSYGGPMGSSRHGGGGFRGGRYEGSSADSSRPSSRGPHPHGVGGSGHMRQPHSADPVPPPEASPWPDPKGLCDLDRFISQIEPVIAIDHAKPPQQALQELKLRDLWNFYFEPSLYGREVFTLGGHRGASNSYFVPYLSAIQIFTRALPTDVGGTNRLYVSEDNQGWPKHMHLKFEYFEQELPFNRLPLYDQIELLSSTMVGGKNAGSGPGCAGGTAGVPPASGSRPAPLAQPAFGHAAVAAPSVAGVATSSAALASGGKEAATDVQDATEKAAPQAAHNIDRSVDAEASEVDDPAGKMGAEAAAAAELPGAEGASAVTTGRSSQAESIAECMTAGRNTSTPTASQPNAGPISTHQASAVQPAHAGTARPPAATAAAAAWSSEAENSGSSGGTGLLYDMRLLDVHPASWFAVAWYPVYRIPDAPLYARFLTFHSFAPPVESMRNVHERLAMGQVAPCNLFPVPVVGLNWYNMQGERWMEPLDESTVVRTHDGPAPQPPIAASGPTASVNSPRGPPLHQRGAGGGGRVPGTDVWYQQWLHNFQVTADRLARGVGLKVLGQHGAEEVRLRVPDYEFFRARA
ncbi:hypothetical protein VaNZ11_016824 [Volvox africanus]|uniref:Uncharacterized protein n=1 Tax=Volvox africanus TaxID=51714 RepID=A0ABQ5SNI1_9CHLO|nr:hypothetical protein VaNZ11_016824 [Volvox africanus]